MSSSSEIFNQIAEAAGRFWITMEAAAGEIGVTRPKVELPDSFYELFKNSMEKIQEIAIQILTHQLSVGLKHNCRLGPCVSQLNAISSSLRELIKRISSETREYSLIANLIPMIDINSINLQQLEVCSRTV